MHSSSVPLVLNTKTGNVTPQFHCLYDDEFASCKRDAKFNSVWQAKAKLFDYVPIKAPPPAEPPPTPKTVYFEPEKQHPIAPPVETSTLPEEFQYQWDDTPIPSPNQPSNNTPPISSVVEEPIIAEAPTVTRTG